MCTIVVFTSILTAATLVKIWPSWWRIKIYWAKGWEQWNCRTRLATSLCLGLFDGRFKITRQTYSLQGHQGFGFSAWRFKVSKPSSSYASSEIWVHIHASQEVLGGILLVYTNIIRFAKLSSERSRILWEANTECDVFVCPFSISCLWADGFKEQHRGTSQSYGPNSFDGRFKP